MNHLPGRELERLSAYIDGELSPREARKLEAQLQRDPSLMQALEQLRSVKVQVGTLPEVRPPRNFTLTADMLGVKPAVLAYPVLRLATAVAAVAFVALVGVDLFTGNVGGGFVARSVAEPAAEAPMMLEQEALDTAKVEPGEAGLEGGAPEAAVEAPLEESEPEAQAMAPEAEVAEEDMTAAEGGLGEQERAGEPHEQDPAEEPLEVPPDEAPMEEEISPSYSATSVPDGATNEFSSADEEWTDLVETPTRATPQGAYWLRGIEIGLAILTLSLGALTLWVRRRSR
jgi:hypothetical protein